MRFYKIRMKNVKPIILTKRRTERGYKGPVESIQSTTLRGALITSLYLNGRIEKDRLRELADKPNVVASYAYPIKDGLESYPAHPFMYECKVDREKINYIGDVVKQLKEGGSAEYRIECSKGHVALNYAHPRPVVPKGDRNAMFETVSVDTESRVSVGISRRRATAQKGMLYEYDVLIENQEFWAFLGISDELSDCIHKDLEVRIGRGVTRGHGLLKLTDVKEISIDEVKDRIRAQIGERMVFYALTPLLGSNSPVHYSPYPKKIDLNDVMGVYGFKLGDCGTISIEKVYGRARGFSCGWDMVRNVIRPSLEGIASEGSIVVARLNVRENTGYALAVLGLIGAPVRVEDFTVFGINVMMSIEVCPIGGG
ncbi:hypothetical protein KEJ27_09240 [Candidatus Bathyarchaeota archaeon]|nr:hypothetical protein [Candidatus Bathyarchaeota archaeon]